MFPCLRATVMAASFALLIACLYGCDLISMCVMVCVLGFATPTPSVVLSLTCKPYVQMNSSGLHFLSWGLVFSIVDVLWEWTGVCMSLYDVPLSMLLASNMMVSSSVVLTV